MVLQIWQKKMKKLTCMTFLCLIALRNKTVAHHIPYSLYLSCIIWRCKCCLCQERLSLWSRNLATMLYLTSHFSSLLLYTHHKISIVTCNKEIIFMSNRPFYRYGGHIEFIRFKEYHRDAQVALAQYLRRLFGQNENFNDCLPAKRWSLLHPNTAQRSFFPITIFF